MDVVSLFFFLAILIERLWMGCNVFSVFVVVLSFKSALVLLPWRMCVSLVRLVFILLAILSSCTLVYLCPHSYV